MLFAEVVDGQMRLNQMGQIIQTVWDSLPEVYVGCKFDAFVIMPNHPHGVIVMGAPGRAIHESPLPPVPIAERRRMLLSKILGRFKMVTSKQINALRRSSGQPLWQRNYYEHVIRDGRSLNHIRQYIAANPVQWGFDLENPAASISLRRGDF